MQCNYLLLLLLLVGKHKKTWSWWSFYCHMLFFSQQRVALLSKDSSPVFFSRDMAVKEESSNINCIILLVATYNSQCALLWIVIIGSVLGAEGPMVKKDEKKDQFYAIQDDFLLLYFFYLFLSELSLLLLFRFKLNCFLLAALPVLLRSDTTKIFSKDSKVVLCNAFVWFSIIIFQQLIKLLMSPL